MLCRDIHCEPEGCPQDIPPEKGWRYCPRCGRLTGHILPPDGRFEVTSGQVSRRSLPIRNNGFTAVAVSVELSPDSTHVRLAADQRAAFVAHPRMQTLVTLEVEPLAHPMPQVGQLILLADDAPLDPLGDPWQTRAKRAIRIPLVPEVESPALIELVHEIALFRSGITEREITLRNQGREPGEVIQVLCPTGYEVTPTSGAVPREGELTLKVRRRWSVPVPTESEMLLRTADGQTFRTLLYCPPVESSAPLPLAVVGIDLGTAFTSVTFRECRHNPLLDDPVVFLRPPGEEKERFPTRIWVGAQGDLVFGSRATEVHREDETAGFLFREIKTLLRGRSRAPEFIDLGWRHNEAIALAQRLFGDAWPQALATRYLRWLYEKTIVPELERRFGTANVNVRYVFSLPVLDYAIEGTEGRAASSRLHQIQRAQMSECIRQAGFPEEQTEFQFEPVCAALGLLYPPIDEPDWPRLGGRRCPIETGHSVAVFDSGGGTTDVVLMRADVEEQSGRVSLEVQSCLGVGTQGETFGGELVTTDLLRALQDPTLVRMPPGARWFEGEMNVEVVLGEDSRRLERDLAEDLKMELAPITCERVLRNREQTIIYPIVLERLMVSYLASLAEELLERVFTEVDRAETRYYLSVGGNTYIAPMQRWIQKFMQDEEEGVASRRRLDIPERYRKLAVAWGAVWVPDARIRNAVPYDLEVASGSDVLLTFRRNTAQEAFYHLSRFQMGPRERREFALHAVVDGGRHRVERRAIVNPLDETALLDVWVGVQNGVVSLSYRLRSPVDEGHKDERTPLWKYRL